MFMHVTIFLLLINSVMVMAAYIEKKTHLSSVHDQCFILFLPFLSTMMFFFFIGSATPGRYGY